LSQALKPNANTTARRSERVMFVVLDQKRLCENTSGRRGANRNPRPTRSQSFCAF
jgi:hypothetical protein